MISQPQKRIAALVPNVLGFSPGQRVRIELWEKYLEEAGWSIEYFPFEDAALHEVLYEPGNQVAKANRIMQCYRRQLSRTTKNFSADVVFIYREAALIGPALPERLAARQNIPVIYDIDDPVFLPYRSPMNGWASLLKFSKKTHKIFNLSARVIAINKIIGDYAAQYNPNVSVVPNCVDTEKYTMSRKHENGFDKKERARLVWIGSRSTMPNLLEIAEPLRRLSAENKTSLLVVGAGEARIEGVDLEMVQWSAQSEVAEIQRGDVGLLPLSKLEWNNWKFFYKIIQYMAVGLPVVASRMGSSSEIIEDGVTGFLVETPDEWFDRLKLLTSDRDLRLKMGRAARKKVIENYSVQSQMPRVVEIFENVLKQSKILNQ